jgi:hypothetical protein
MPNLLNAVLCKAAQILEDGSKQLRRIPVEGALFKVIMNLNQEGKMKLAIAINDQDSGLPIDIKALAEGAREEIYNMVKALKVLFEAAPADVLARLPRLPPRTKMPTSR